MRNVLDLFCGASGGWSLGLERAGYRTVAACEIDPWRRSVFAAAHPGCRMYADVRELTGDRLQRDLGYLPDVVVGSPPCQEISAANTKGKGITDDHLFWDWARLVFEIRPIWCAAENSPNARTENIDGILDALGSARYAFWPCVVGADNAGANHRRKRLWLVAADAERLELWQQSGRGSGSHGRPAAVAGEHDRAARMRDRAALGGSGGTREHDPDAHGRLARGARRHADGCVELGARADEHDHHADRKGQHGRARDGEMAGGMDGDSRDTTRERRAKGRPEPVEQGHCIDAGPCGNDADAESVPFRAGLPRSDERRQSRNDGCRSPPDADSTRHPLRPRLGSDDGEELPAALRDIGRAWPHWNGGLAGLAAACAAAGFGAVDDGSDAILAPGLRNRAIAALGDAVIPVIPEAIGRAMTSVLFA